MGQRERILRILSDGKRHHTREFLRAYMPRFSEFVRQLRKSGYEITTERVDGGAWYRMERRPYTVSESDICCDAMTCCHNHMIDAADER